MFGFQPYCLYLFNQSKKQIKNFQKPKTYKIIEICLSSYQNFITWNWKQEVDQVSSPEIENKGLVKFHHLKLKTTTWDWKLGVEEENQRREVSCGGDEVMWSRE
jgi:hypothetical protein